MNESIHKQLKKILVKKKDQIIKKSDLKKLSTDITKASQSLARGGIRPGKLLPFEPLKRLTVMNRLTLSKMNATHGSYSPSKSNATFSGNMIDSFRPYKERGRHFFRVGYYIPDVKHPGYNTGKKVMGSKKYTTIRRKLRRYGKDPAGFTQSNMGHPFYQYIRKLIKREISKSLS